MPALPTLLVVAVRELLRDDAPALLAELSDEIDELLVFDERPVPPSAANLPPRVDRRLRRGAAAAETPLSTAADTPTAAERRSESERRAVVVEVHWRQAASADRDAALHPHQRCLVGVRGLLLLLVVRSRREPHTIGTH